MHNAHTPFSQHSSNDPTSLLAKHWTQVGNGCEGNRSKRSYVWDNALPQMSLVCSASTNKCNRCVCRCLTGRNFSTCGKQLPPRFWGKSGTRSTSLSEIEDEDDPEDEVEEESLSSEALSSATETSEVTSTMGFEIDSKGISPVSMLPSSELSKGTASSSRSADGNGSNVSDFTVVS